MCVGCGKMNLTPTTRYHSAHIVPVPDCGDGTNRSVGAVADKLKLESRGAIDPVAHIYCIGGIWCSGYEFHPHDSSTVHLHSPECESISGAGCKPQSFTPPGTPHGMMADVNTCAMAGPTNRPAIDRTLTKMMTILFMAISSFCVDCGRPPYLVCIKMRVL